jgi:hypothetical protein
MNDKNVKRPYLKGDLETKGTHRPLWRMGLVGLIVLMGLMSCSSEEGGDLGRSESGTVIAFSAKQDEGTTVTRATSLHEEGIETFKVWGYKNMDETYSESGLQTVFPGYTVNWLNGSAATTTTNSSGWEYILTSKPDQTIKFWDWSAKAYRFFGVTGEANGTYETNGADRTYQITIDPETSYYSHLWFSTGNIAMYPTKEFGKPVQLVFMKPSSKVRFMFTFVNSRDGIEMGPATFKPTNETDIAQKGTVTVNYPLTGTATQEWLTLASITESLSAFTEYYDPEDDTKEYRETDNGWYTVLPNSSQGSYTLEVKINNDTKTCAVPADFMQWLPGYSYTYIFKINEEGGVEIDLVQSAFTGWTTEVSTQHTVYNW